MEAASFSRPWTVEFAIYALSTTLILGLLRTVFGLDLSDLPIDPLLLYSLIFGSTFIAGLLIHKIWSRKNWARIVYALVLGLGMFKTVPALGYAFDASIFTGLFSAAIIAVKLGAVVLLFLPPSNTWFQHREL